MTVSRPYSKLSNKELLEIRKYLKDRAKKIFVEWKHVKLELEARYTAMEFQVKALEKVRQQEQLSNKEETELTIH